MYSHTSLCVLNADLKDGVDVYGSTYYAMTLVMLVGRCAKPFRSELVSTGSVQCLATMLTERNFSTDLQANMLNV